VPDVKDVVDDVADLEEHEKMPWLSKRLLPLFRADSLAKGISKTKPLSLSFPDRFHSNTPIYGRHRT
jgi:hypothetical protein